MQLGARAVPFRSLAFDEALAVLDDAGVEAVELSVGGYAGSPFVTATEAVANETARTQLRETAEAAGLDIAALGCHNNPLHPDPETAAEADSELRAAIELADQLDVDVVSCFSGLPGGTPDDVTPTWITAPWPPEHRAAYEYQWEEVAVPYWRELESVAAERDVDIAIEMHLNMLVHTPLDVCRLREATGPRLTATFDPSHLYPQSIDVVETVSHLAAADALAHVHLKDVTVLAENAALGGWFDQTPWMDRENRSWTFSRPGTGHDAGHWSELFDTLRAVGYDGCLAIEHFRGDVEGPETGIPKTASFVMDAL